VILVITPAYQVSWVRFPGSPAKNIDMNRFLAVLKILETNLFLHIDREGYVQIDRETSLLCGLSTFGRDPKTGKRKQATKGGLKSEEEAQLAVTSLLNEVKGGTYRIWVSVFGYVIIASNLVAPSTLRICIFHISLITMSIERTFLRGNIISIRYPSERISNDMSFI
jgi:hypothetical protein